MERRRLRRYLKFPQMRQRLRIQKQRRNYSRLQIRLKTQKKVRRKTHQRSLKKESR